MWLVTDGKIIIWNSNTGNRLKTIQFDAGYPLAICYSHDGKKMASGGIGKNNLRIYDLTTLDAENLMINGPGNIYLSPNYPNPFNPSTKIDYIIPISSKVNIKIFDALGRELITLVDRYLAAGNYTVSWQPENIASGIYFYKLQAGKYTEIKKMVYIR